MTRIVEAADRGALARLLAVEIAAVLEAAIRGTGRAALAVPGGTTPVAFLSALGGHALDWAAVAVTLTDERCVPADHPRSNRRLLDGTLFAGPARAAQFVALDDEQALSALLPLDACVLGMGEDLHIASLFPGADRLDEALSAECGPPALRLHAPGAPEERITLTAPALTGAGRCFVLIHGAGKRAALDRISHHDHGLRGAFRPTEQESRAARCGASGKRLDTLCRPERAALRVAPRRPPAASRASTVCTDTLFGPVLAGRTPGRDAGRDRGEKCGPDRARAAAGPADAPVCLVLDGPNPATVYWAP